MSPPTGGRGSTLLVEEFFERQDDRFLDALRKEASAPALAGFAERWKTDPRPWARRQMIAYLELPWDCPGHQPVVKRLFKHAEEQRDDELMAVFLVALDRLVRRERRRRHSYDWQTRQVVEEEVLALPRDTIPSDARIRRVFRSPRTGEQLHLASRAGKRFEGTLFSYRTRYYLRRRVWRYFRRMGYQRPGDYPTAVARGLVRYRDEDLQRGEHILDSWSLMQICFREHDALEFGTSKVALKPERSLAELSPAPRFPELWQEPESLDVPLMLAAGARARLVRVWAMELLRRDHQQALGELHPEDLFELLNHDDEEVQRFGADVLENSRGLDRLPLETWMRLLQTRSLAALETICRVMSRHVSAERLTLAECVTLGSAEPTPVARLGFAFVQTKQIETAEQRRIVADLSRVRCEAVGHDVATWALPLVGAADTYDRDLVIRFFDSLCPTVRGGAWEWLHEGVPAWNDPVLWARLLETPFDDLRLRLIDRLESRSRFPRPSSDELGPVWCTVLAGVHRGGRQKPKAVRQVARAIEEDPARADDLLPVLALAARSIRAPEMREALAAVVSLVDSRPELTDRIRLSLPELTLEPEAAH